jgi:hypothetical protein
VTTRYLICGGRDFADDVLLHKVLRALILHPDDAVIIQGAARGADSMAAIWGTEHGASVLSFTAEWATYGKAAGAIRNRQMLDEGRPDVVIAFPGGKGTANMVQQARARKLVTIVVTGEGGDWYGNGGDG